MSEGKTALNIILSFWFAFALSSFGILGANYVVTRRAAKRAWKIRSDNGYMPRVSIIIPTYNEYEVIGYKLRNLAKLKYPACLSQMVFVDSRSTDGTTDKIRDFAERNPNEDIKIIVEEERKGKTAALNTALKDCNGEVVIVSDADCFWPSSILNQSLGYLSDSSVGAVSGPKKLLNSKDSWVTRSESRYLESMNSVKLGESKMSSTIFFEGGFSAFKRAVLDAFDPYDTGSDDCGTVIRILEQNKRAIMVPEAEFYTFFPRSWKGKTDIKIRRAVQLVRVLRNYSTLLSKGRMKAMNRTVIRNTLLYVFAPIMFLCFIVTTILLMFVFPPSVLLFSVFLIPKANTYLFEATSGFLTMSIASLLALLKKKSVLWKKPEDRKLVLEKPLAEAGLI